MSLCFRRSVKYPLAVIGYRFWRDRFLGDPAMVGLHQRRVSRNYADHFSCSTKAPPARAESNEALDQISGLRDKPASRVRLLVPRFAAMTVLAPKLGQFARDYPDIVLDVTADDSRMDIVAGGFDAGIHYGEFIERDMIAVRVSKDHRAAIGGAPAYFKSNPRPKTPHDLIATSSAEN